MFLLAFTSFGMLTIISIILSIRIMNSVSSCTRLAAIHYSFVAAPGSKSLNSTPVYMHAISYRSTKLHINGQT